MKVQLLIIGLLALCQGYYARSLVEPFESRIVNGVDVQRGEIPYQISIQYIWNDYHFCGGSILNKKYVITAAHCVQGVLVSNIKIIAGSVKLSAPVRQYRVEKIIIHEEYDKSNSWKNDIALIKIKSEFVPTALLGFVPMPEPGMVIPADTKAIVSGWGNIRFLGPSPDHLRKAQILIADQEYCKQRYSGTVHDSQICAHDPVQQTGSCQGDSGGPLTVDGKLVGLVSWARGCALIDYPTVYTRVSEFIDWIDTNAV